MAAADRASVWAAFRANRLYVPTRTLDDRANIPAASPGRPRSESTTSSSRTSP